MTPRDDWMMGALAAQDAYRGAYPDWPAPGEAPAGPMGALAREDNYAPTDAELDRARNPPMPRAPAMGDWAATDRGPILPDAGGAQLGAIGNVMRRLAPKGIAAAEYYVGTPSRAVAGPDIGDYPPGSEEAEFLRQRHAKNLQDWSQSTALGMVADPLTLWGMRGTVGSGAGSKIIQPQPKMGDLAGQTTYGPALEAIQRQGVVRGRSGRPIQTAPLPIGTEPEILERGFAAATGPKAINSFDDIRNLLDQHGTAYVRWSASPKHDMTPGAVSRDYQTGQAHGGLSAQAIERDFSDDQLFRFLRDYGYLRSKGNEAAMPRLYAGKSVGRDSDLGDSIVPTKYLGTLSPNFVRFLDNETNRQRMLLTSDLAKGQRALDYYADNPPNYIPTWTPERVADIKSRLEALGGPVEMPGSRPPQPEMQAMARTGQPQPKMGDLAEPPTLPAPWLDPTLARQIQRATREGGSTTNVNTGESPTSGLMMGIYKNADPRAFNTPGRVTQADLENFVQTNRSALRLAGRSDLVGPRQPGDRYLGTWRDPDTGVAYVDVSQRFDPDQIRQATKFGERTGQIAGWDLGAKVPIPVGNWPAYITEPAFHQRMHEMADVGRQYLSQHPTREWWTNEPFARVYGEERMPQVAGYTAATAPNAAPRENLQTMSEYMRRHIRGEPVLQPDWRVPEGMMTRSPGAQIGMEQSRALNLDRAFRGATSELQRQKVREEAQALLGDQWAVVLDRHWARLAEDPSRGVFANAQEGVISSAPRKGPTDYDLLKTEVTKAAQVAGRTPNGFSADVWTGIRDTIQRTSELYGQKFRGSAITGESKSYADHFEDLIRDKAQHLGITAGEMEKRLRSGDANLMSWVLATTPAAWQAYRQYQGHTASSSSGKIQPSAGGPRTGRDEL